jgi:hypothetical protein
MYKEENIAKYTQEEKISVCYTPCGPTFRKSVIEKLNNYYFDNDNIYYCILTDKKDDFKNIKRKNLIVNELKDFYADYPELEENEYFLESESKEDYAQKCLNGYLFPFSTMRFNLIQSKLVGVSNVSMICTDTSINFNDLNKLDFSKKNILYNALSQWEDKIQEYDNLSSQMFHCYLGVKEVVRILKEKYGLEIDNTFTVFDEAARLYILEDLNKLDEFFIVWNGVIAELYKYKMINYFKGSYVVHDEYILGLICNALKITHPKNINNHIRLFNVNHNAKEERFWS